MFTLEFEYKPVKCFEERLNIVLTKEKGFYTLPLTKWQMVLIYLDCHMHTLYYKILKYLFSCFSLEFHLNVGVGV